MICRLGRLYAAELIGQNNLRWRFSGLRIDCVQVKKESELVSAIIMTSISIPVYLLLSKARGKKGS